MIIMIIYSYIYLFVIEGFEVYAIGKPEDLSL